MASRRRHSTCWRTPWRTAQANGLLLMPPRYSRSKRADDRSFNPAPWFGKLVRPEFSRVPAGVPEQLPGPARVIFLPLARNKRLVHWLAEGVLERGGVRA